MQHGGECSVGGGGDVVQGEGREYESWVAGAVD